MILSAAVVDRALPAAPDCAGHSLEGQGGARRFAGNRDDSAVGAPWYAVC